MSKENISQKSKLKNIEETKNYFIKEIDQNELMSKKHKKLPTKLNYTEHFFFLASVVTGCVSISVFASLVGIPIGTTSPVIGWKNCTITAGIKKYKIERKPIRIITSYCRKISNK